MKYTFSINQYGIWKSGLAGKTDLLDWALLDYIQDWFFNEKAKKLDIEENETKTRYVWINYNHILKSNPLLAERDDSTKKVKKLDKDAITERLRKLQSLGLIKLFKTKDNSIYVHLTDKFVSVKENREVTDECEFENTYPENGDRLSPKKGQAIPETGIGPIPEKGIAQYNNKSSIEINKYNNISSYIIALNDENIVSEPSESSKKKNSNLSSKNKIIFNEQTNDWEYDQSLLDAYKKAYPLIDVPLELAKARAWVMSNPTKKKKNWAQFINNWLSKAQLWAERREAEKHRKKRQSIMDVPDEFFLQNDSDDFVLDEKNNLKGGVNDNASAF